MLYLVCCGEVGVDQDGRTARIGAGDLFIYDQSQPFTLEFGGYSRGIVLTIPRPLMVSRLPTSHRLTAHRIDGRSQLGALTASIVRQIVDFDAALEEEVANRVSASALDILATTLEVEIAGALDDGAAYGGRLDQVLCAREPRRCGHDHRNDRVGAPRRAPHAASPVLGRRNNTDSLALAATPDGELQSPRRRPLAHGQRQWVELALVLCGRPNLILLDEPAAGMTEEDRVRTTEIIREINREHPLIVVEHDMSFIRTIARRITVFDRGTILMEGDVDQVFGSQAVRDVYLGKQAAA
jgi:hypothetical protein